MKARGVALSIRERIRESQTVRGRAVLGAMLLAVLLVVTLATRELDNAIAQGGASTSEAILREQNAAAVDAAQRDGALAITSKRASDALRAQASAEQAQVNAETARAALADKLERLTPGPLPNDSRIAWAQGAVVGIKGNQRVGTGFAVSYRGGSTYIMTALHVLGGASAATVTTRQGDYSGQLVAVSSADAAILKIDALIPVLFFRVVRFPEPVTLVRYSDGLSEPATVIRVSDKVMELALPSRTAGHWAGFSGGPVITAEGDVIGIMSSDDGIHAQVVPRSATCDILSCL